MNGYTRGWPTARAPARVKMFFFFTGGVVTIDVKSFLPSWVIAVISGTSVYLWVFLQRCYKILSESDKSYARSTIEPESRRPSELAFRLRRRSAPKDENVSKTTSNHPQHNANTHCKQRRIILQTTPTYGAMCGPKHVQYIYNMIYNTLYNMCLYL